MLTTTHLSDRSDVPQIDLMSEKGGSSSPEKIGHTVGIVMQSLQHLTSILVPFELARLDSSEIAFLYFHGFLLEIMKSRCGAFWSSENTRRFVTKVMRA